MKDATDPMPNSAPKAVMTPSWIDAYPKINAIAKIATNSFTAFMF